MKVDRIIETSEKFTTHAAHLDELYCKKILDKRIFISNGVKKATVSFFLYGNYKSNCIDGYSRIMTKQGDT